jgi:hypothetical protein
MPLNNVLYYSRSGLDKEIDSNNLLVDAKHPNIYAKSEHFEDGKIGYYVKADVRRRLCDPWGPLFKESDLRERFSTRAGPKYQFLKVPEHVFDYYLKYLCTRNRSYLSYAERARY